MTDRAKYVANGVQGGATASPGGRAQPADSTGEAPAAEAPAGAGPGADGPASVSQFYTYRLHKLLTMMNRQMHDELQARYSLGLAEWRSIAVLGEFGPLSLRDVARRGAIDKAQVSRLLPGLIRRGYVARDAHPTDRRRASLRLTDTGLKLYGEILVLGRQRQNWLVEALTGEERTMLVDSLDRLLARIEAEPAGPFATPKAAE